MNKNFQALNDILFIKFQQVEDVKQTLKDILVFKSFLPSPSLIIDC